MRLFCFVLMLLALVMSACGSDGDGTSSFVPPSTTPTVGDGLPPEVRHPVARTADRLQRAFANRDYAGFCAWVTPSAAREAGEAAHGTATTCERDVRRLFGLIRKGGGWRHVNTPRVTHVNTHGATATATIALDRRWQARVALARIGGRWQLNGLFGAPTKGAQRLAERIAGTDFPPPGDEPVRVAGGDGSPCPDLDETGYPTIKGGCALQVGGRITPLTILAPFGDFEFERCSIAYRVRVDAAGRTWTEEFDVQGGPDSAACGDVNACFDYRREALAPWRGRIYSDGHDGFVHRIDMCLRTCIGYFVGRLNLRLVREDDAWRAVPIDGGGDTGFRFDSPLVVKGDFDLGAGRG